jgi:putative hemolysin
MQQANFSYAEPDDPLFARALIRLVEIATGQPELKRLYELNQARPYPGASFFEASMRRLRVDVHYDASRLDLVPREGPLVFVANHPFGVVDGLAMGGIVEKARGDFLILTNAVLLRAPEIRDFVLPVDFSGTREALETNLRSRNAARTHLAKGGSLVVFPAGAVSTAPDRWGRRPAVDTRWPPFVAQLVQRARAPVVPVYFAGQNSRLFQMVSHISLTMRLALLFNEVRNKIGTRLDVEIGAPIPFEDLAAVGDRQAMADALMRRTYELGTAIPGEPVRLRDEPA